MNDRLHRCDRHRLADRERTLPEVLDDDRTCIRIDATTAGAAVTNTATNSSALDVAAC